MCDELPRDGSEEAISFGWGHRRWEQPSDLQCGWEIHRE